MNRLLTPRNLLWVLALGVTVWLSLNAPKPKTNVVEVSETSHIDRQPEVSADKATNFALTPRSESVTGIANLFSAPIKIVQNPIVTKPRIAAALPDLPFEFIGFVEEQGLSKVILDHQGEIMALKPGDRINGQYQLLAINKTGSGAQLKFLFIPKNLTQTMVVNNE